MPVYELPKKLIVFPDPNEAIDDGLVAIGGDLSLKRLLLAYSMGIFPWFSINNPILWWSPDPRFVLFPDDFKISKSLSKTISDNNFTVRADTRFPDVILQCASMKRKHEKGTWITDEMIKAYINLHKNGFAHSIETFLNEKLVGGLYGVSLGKAFFGESMFHIVPDASKVALFHLVSFARLNNFMFIDSQIKTEHLAKFGAKNISRKEYLGLLEKAMKHNTVKGKWNIS